MPQNSADTIIKEWLNELTACREANAGDDPNYYCHNPQELITSCTPLSFELGTGSQLVESIVQKCAAARSEVLIVTCFWAASPSLESLSTLLQHLSKKACRENRIIRVRIGFSSRSLSQKLLHTSSLNGEQYPSSAWAAKLGLPPRAELPGLDISIKSVFILPFSVMHPKFVIVDRQRAFLPSCNISWEDWFEGCIEFQGELVTKLLRFWQEFWGRDEPSFYQMPAPQYRDSPQTPPSSPGLSQRPNWPDGSPQSGRISNHHPRSPSRYRDQLNRTQSSRSIRSISNHHPQPASNGNLPTSPTSAASPLFTTQFRFSHPSQPISALLLPSPHHQNPQFRPLSLSAAPPPPTPLNTFLLHIFRAAKQQIYIQTPNVTSGPVIDALYTALTNGVNVHIVTSSLLMLLEQLVTAGTITEVALWFLQRKYKQYVSRYFSSSSSRPNDIEAQRPKPGILTIEYYHPADGGTKADASAHVEPVKSHLKLVIVDERIVVLGSGNMDRASWYTSQELGIAFFSEEVAKVVREGVGRAMGGRGSGEGVVIGGAVE